MPEDDVLTPKKAAAELDVSLNTVYGYLDEGTLRGYRYREGGRWKIPASEISRLKPDLSQCDDSDD